jgi:hypothetical protein
MSAAGDYGALAGAKRISALDASDFIFQATELLR